MIKKLFSILFLGMTALAVHAEGVITLSDFELRIGGTENVMLNLSTEVENYRGFQFNIVLPQGITVTGIFDAGRCTTTGAADEVSINKKVGSATTVAGTTMQEQVIVFAADHNFTAGNGDLARLTFSTEASVAAGVYFGRLEKMILSYAGGSTEPVADAEFTITVYAGNARVTLNETSTEMPEATNDAVDVTLNRMVKAGEWNTICLPFSATGEQVKAAFGNDVALSAFTAWESEEDDEGAIVAINVTFTEADVADGIEANVPMLIRVSETVTTATFNGVTLEPEDEPMVQVGKKASQRGYFYGTYVKTKVPEENLFLSGNKFYYSTGLTSIKGYRGYFAFRDVLDAYYDVANVKFNFFVDGEVTRIDGIVNGQSSNGKLFDLSGRQVAKPQQKGVYIVKGKKVIIK